MQAAVLSGGMEGSSSSGAIHKPQATLTEPSLRPRLRNCGGGGGGGAGRQRFFAPGGTSGLPVCHWSPAGLAKLAVISLPARTADAACCGKASAFVRSVAALTREAAMSRRLWCISCCFCGFSLVSTTSRRVASLVVAGVEEALRVAALRDPASTHAAGCRRSPVEGVNVGCWLF